MVFVGLSWPIPCIMHCEVVVLNCRSPLIWSRVDKPLHRGGTNRWYKVHNSNHHISKLSHRYQSAVVLLSLAPPVYKGYERTSTKIFDYQCMNRPQTSGSDWEKCDFITTCFQIGHFGFLNDSTPLYFFCRCTLVKQVP